MTKKQIIDLVATKAHLTKKAAREAIDTFLAEITKSLKKGEKILLPFIFYFVPAPMFLISYFIGSRLWDI